MRRSRAQISISTKEGDNLSEQMRKVQITINNPQECGLDHEAIKQILMRFNPTYYCLCDEIASTGTPHTHVFMYSTSAFRFSTVKRRLPTAHIEPRCYGSVKDNVDYIRKQGKWIFDRKAETSIPGTFEEWGNLPDESAEKSPGMYELIQEVQSGKTTGQIIFENPKFAFRSKDIDILRQTLNAERFASENREVSVVYLYGASGVGKTRSIFTQYKAYNICRITNYANGKGIQFDAYHGQDILVFEEFHAQVPIGDMLNYLDIYPIMLPARYSDKVGCYTKVYITSNIPLDQQYDFIQHNQAEVWKAFLRRISKIIELKADGSTVEHSKEEYI